VILRRLARATSDDMAAWRGVALALGLTAAATAARAVLEPLMLGVAPFATYYVSTVAAALFGGIATGLLAAAVGTLIAWLLFVHPAGGFDLATPGAVASLGVVLLTKLVVVLLAAGLREALRRAEAAERALGTKVAELEALMDLAPVGIWFARGPEVREVTRNRFAAEMMRLPPGTGVPLGGRASPEVELRRGGLSLPPEEMPLQRALRGEESRDEEYEFAFPDGSATALLSNARPIRDAAGRITGAVSASLDVTALKRTEAALREAVASRELLQREADHRIKNSLQLVAGVLRLQRGRTHDAELAHMLDEAASRVQAVAQAHAALQRSPDLQHADMCKMVAELCGFVGRLDPAVEVTCTCEGEAMLEVERAIPLGLVVTELLTNAARHAYPEGQGGAVRVRIAARDGAVEVEVRDDGVGLAEEAREGGLGRELVRGMSARIGATVETRSEAGRGTVVRLVVPAPCAAADPTATVATRPRVTAPAAGA